MRKRESKDATDDRAQMKILKTTPCKVELAAMFQPNFVSRETTGRGEPGLFHVKHLGKVREGLLTYTELAEDDVQNVFDIHAAQQPP